jgi:hypothetical protein
LDEATIKKAILYVFIWEEYFKKMFSSTTGPEKLNLHEGFLTMYKCKFVKVMKPRGRIGPQ